MKYHQASLSLLGPLLWNIIVFRLPYHNCGGTAIWMIRYELETAGILLADHQTKAVPITSRKCLHYVEKRFGKQTIKSKEVIKHLGVIFNNKEKNLLQSAILRMLPFIRGHRYVCRVLLFLIISSVIQDLCPDCN